MPPLRFRGVARSKQLVAVRPTGAYAMKVHGDERLKRLEPDDLAPSESALLAAKPHDLLFERNDAVGLVGGLAGGARTAIRRLDPGGCRGGRPPAPREVLAALRSQVGSGRSGARAALSAARCGGAMDVAVVQASGMQAAATAAPAAETAAPQDARVSARRWSNEEQAAAGVDPSLETWELTLRRPRGDAFEIRGVREVPLSGLPVVVSLASLPEATAQRGEVVIRSLRPAGLERGESPSEGDLARAASARPSANDSRRVSLRSGSGRRRGGRRRRFA